MGDRSPRRGDGVIRSPQRTVNCAEVGESFDIAGFGRNGLHDEPGRGLMISALMRDQPEMMETKEMIRPLCKYFSVEDLRFVIAADAVIFEGAGEIPFDPRGADRAYW
jgi:hypothetical protein